MKKVTLASLLLTTFFTFLFTTSQAQFTQQPITLRALDQDMNSFVTPPDGFVQGGDRDVVISVTYNGFSSEAQAAFQYAVDIWASTLTSTVPIIVDATWTNLGTGVLGQAGANFYWNSVSGGDANTYYPDALADKLAGFDNSPGEPDITAEFNSTFNWYFGTDGNTPGGQYDFVTIVLHELGHGLGVSGFGWVESGLGYVLANGDPSIYDTFVENGSGVSIEAYTEGSTTLATQLQSNNLFWNGALAMANNGGVEPKIYAPNPWEGGSSYSHIDEDTYPAGNANSLMTPFVGAAEANHNPGPIIIGLLGDIGWETTTDGGGGDIFGCTDPAANNYNPTATVDDGSCIYDGDCTINSINIYPNGCGENGIQNMEYTFDFAGDCIVQEICIADAVNGDFCADLSENNLGDGDVWGWVNFGAAGDYDFYYTLSDGTVSPTGTLTLESCTPNEGCTNPYALNYDSTADTDDESCVYDDTICDCAGTVHSIGVLVWVGDGFADDSAYEWEEQLVDFDCSDWAFDCGDINGGSGTDPYSVCDGSFPLNTPPNNGCGGDILGCTDPTALNYNPLATLDDGSCEYELECWIQEDFDSYSNGSLLAVQSLDITTWTGAEGGDEDAPATNVNFFSAPNSMQIEQNLEIGGATDILIPISASDGTVSTSWMMDVAQGFGAYFNIQMTTVPAEGWAYEFFFNADGTYTITNMDGAVEIGAGTYPAGWFSVETIVDLNDNTSVILLNGAPVANMPWFTDLGGVNFYAFSGDGNFGLYHIDDFAYCESTEVLGCTDPAATNYNSAATIDVGSCTYNGNCVINSINIYPNGCGENGIQNMEYTFDFAGDCIVQEICIADAVNGDFCADLSENNLGDGDVWGWVNFGAAGDYDFYYTLSDGTVSPTGTLTLESCTPNEGCTNPYALNYDSTADTDDESCVYDDTICDCAGTVHSIGVLVWVGDGFADDSAYEWEEQLVDFDCSDWAFDCGDINGDSGSDPYNVCDGSFPLNMPPNNGCVGDILGCTDPTAINYDASATLDDGSCEYDVLGCTDPSAINYDPDATIDDGSCDYDVMGCTLIDACNYNPLATINDGSCDFTCYGCTDSLATNYDANATIDDGSCLYDDIEGCTDSGACNYDPSANVEDGSCEYVSCAGCTDFEACNFDFEATIDDGSCDYSCYGCTDSEATNYDPDATIDDGSCIFGDIEGCTDSTACNYDEFATIDDGSCEYETCAGCTDTTALNYDSNATIDDGSCVYDCVYPMIMFTPFCEDGELTGFYVEMDISDLGNGAPYNVSNNQNADEIQLSFTGVIELGPFDNGVQVVITVASELYPDCLITSPLLVMNCDPDNVEEASFAGANIFPNPNSGEFTINVGDHQGTVLMDIYDITGKRIVSDQYTVVTGESRQVSLQGDLALGTYVLRLSSAAKNEQFRLVIR